jgi:TP901 family phage tail tape measure protein
VSLKRNDVTLRIGGETDGLDRSLRRSGNSITTFERRAVTSFRKINHEMAQGMKRAIINPIAGLAGGAAILTLSKQIVDYDARVTRLAINANTSAEEQMRLKKEMIETGIATGQSRNDVAEGVEKIVEKIGDLDLARFLMKDMGIAATATGASMQSMGALAVEFADKMGLTKEEMASAFNVLTVQGKDGAYTLKDLADMGERLFSAASGFNIQGMEGIKSFGAFLQVARKGTGNSAQATTAVEGALTDIIDKQKIIRKLAKFDIIDRAKSKNGVDVLKDFETVLKGIIEGTKGNIPTLMEIFGRESIRAIRPMAVNYQATGRFDKFDSFKNSAIGRETEILKDFARYSETAAYKLDKLLNVGTKFADVALAPSIDNLAKSIDNLLKDPEKLKEFESSLQSLGEALAAFAKVAEVPLKLLSGWGQFNSWVAEWAFGSSDKAIQKKIDDAARLAKTGREEYDIGSQGSVQRMLDNFAISQQEEIKPVIKNTVNPQTVVNVHNYPNKTIADTTASNGTASTKINRGSFLE